MKTIFLALVFTLLSLTSASQSKVMELQEAKKSGILTATLTSIYPRGLHTDSTKSVFWDKRDEFNSAFEKTLKDLEKYLKDNKFIWDKTECFSQICFNKNGQIDYFLYHFSKNEISPEKEKEFDILLNKFVKNYTFPLKAETGFSQSGILRHNK